MKRTPQEACIELGISKSELRRRVREGEMFPDPDWWMDDARLFSLRGMMVTEPRRPVPVEKEHETLVVVANPKFKRDVLLLGLLMSILLLSIVGVVVWTLLYKRTD